MSYDLYPGEVELKRVKEKDIGWITKQVVADRGNGPEIVEIKERDHPMEEGQRWVYDELGDIYDKHPEEHEWVLLGPGKK